MPEKKTDPISLWFDTAEELGEYIGIRFGRVPPGSTEAEWVFLRHTDFDGVGGFAELLRQRGANLRRLPQIRYPSSPSWFSLLKALPRYLKPRRRIQWGPTVTDGQSAEESAQPPSAVAWHVFDESATTHIRWVCRKAGVTVNSFLLKNLTRAIRPFLEDESSEVPWMIPVNLRGKVFRDRDTTIHTSYVAVKIRSYETVHDIHHKIYAALGRGEHWANWFAYRSGTFLTKGLRKYLIVKERAMSQWNLGAFSNMGDWDPEKRISQANCTGAWLFCPPVLRCQLIGAGCITFQNRLSLTIQAHPNLTSDPAVPRAWVQNWVKEIDTDVASAFAEPVAIP